MFCFCRQCRTRALVPSCGRRSCGIGRRLPTARGKLLHASESVHTDTTQHTHIAEELVSRLTKSLLPRVLRMLGTVFHQNIYYKHYIVVHINAIVALFTPTDPNRDDLLPCAATQTPSSCRVAAASHPSDRQTATDRHNTRQMGGVVAVRPWHKMVGRVAYVRTHFRMPFER